MKYRPIGNYIPTKITPREQEVLYLIAYEHSTKPIASKLYVSYETACTHRKNIMNKLGAKNNSRSGQGRI